jgi:hypothetical protein
VNDFARLQPDAEQLICVTFIGVFAKLGKATISLAVYNVCCPPARPSFRPDEKIRISLEDYSDIRYMGTFEIRVEVSAISGWTFTWERNTPLPEHNARPTATNQHGCTHTGREEALKTPDKKGPLTNTNSINYM